MAFFFFTNIHIVGIQGQERERKIKSHLKKQWLKISLYCFFKYKFIYFNWRLITLQYCIGFAIHQHESATGFLKKEVLGSGGSVNEI